ncbi:GNAT family N-acetyltransferase [Haladaptatus sp. CMAA 1911]|uniref:GNAT family N-acetyltransferase n=1 Tax=unclassified Haladaptatus TaxID=2622732 RepID=UPI0037541506
MKFREATPEDAESIQQIAHASWHSAYDHHISEETVEDILEMWCDRDALTESIDRGDALMLLATTSDEIIGFVQGEPTDHGPADATIGRIYVLPEYWGEGAGTQLLNRLFDSFRAAGHESVWLGVMAGNEVGRSFYDKHGFEVHEERTVELAGEKVDDIVLVRDL